MKKFFLIGILLSIAGSNVFSQTYEHEAHRRELAENELQLQKLESEKKQEELQHRATELEMQALRAQMNPHFIFNCLSSINRFILKNESGSASDYLTRFSRLIRMVLTNSKHTLISLEDELEMLRLYLDLEKLRFRNSFNYSIIFNNSIDVPAIEVPPLLLQPFVENAIWHGLMHKEGQGHIDIELSIKNNFLNCVIRDNGVGREKAAAVKSESSNKQKSLGLQITAERLNLFNGEMQNENFFTIEDIVDEQGNAAGTKVVLKIRIKNADQMQTVEM
jgi:sensor histidine kinase YesM